MPEAALYPGIITTQLYQVVARKSTTLSADVDNSNTNLAVASTSGFETVSFISVNDETMLATVLDGTNFTVSRSYAGTAASHNEGDTVKAVVAAGMTNRQNLEIIAIQTHAGTSGGTAGYVNARYLFGKTEGQFLLSGSTAADATLLGGSTEGQLSVLNAAQLGSVVAQTVIENDIEFAPDAFNLDNANPASTVEIDGDADQPRIKKIEFGNTDYGDLPVFKMPRSYDGGAVTWSLIYCSSTASSVFDIGLQAAIGGAGTSYNPVYSAAVYFGNITASATTGIVAYTELSVAAVSLGLTNDALNYLRVLGGTTCTVQILNMGLIWDKG